MISEGVALFVFILFSIKLISIKHWHKWVDFEVIFLLRYIILSKFLFSDCLQKHTRFLYQLNYSIVLLK